MSAPAADAALLHAFSRAVVALLDRDEPADPAVTAELSAVRARLQRLAAPAAAGLAAGEAAPAPPRHLTAALDGWRDGGEEVRAALSALADRLPWRFSYAPRADAPDLAERVAWAELVGPSAPIRSDRLCVGVTLIAPHTLYPDHRHPAIELYRVLSGTATWSAAGVARPVPPGEWVLHPSGVVHAMRTGAEPLLALYTWSGEDVVTTSSWA